MKAYIFLIGLLPFFFTACEEVGLEENANDVTYLYFSKDATKDTTSTSFKFFITDTIELAVPMRVAGKWLTEDMEFTLSADEKLTTLPADKYIIEDKYIFRANREYDTVYVRFINTPELQDKNLLLVLKVDETETIKEGQTIYQRGIYSVTDRIFKPEWWSVLDGGNMATGYYYYNIAEEYYLGKYSEKKYLMFLEVLNGEPFDGKDRLMLRKYSLLLKYKVKAFNEDPANIASGAAPMKDPENNENMTIPVNG